VRDTFATPSRRMKRHPLEPTLLDQCLRDIFFDNHDVIVDGRVADIGSFRGAC